MKVRAVNGRWCRAYLTDARETRPLCVTYHKRIRGVTRQLTVSPRLLAQVLR